MDRRWMAAAAVGIAAWASWWTFGTQAPVDAGSPGARVHTVRRPAPPAGVVSPEGSTDGVRTAFVARVSAIADTCGLPVASMCADGVCAATVVGPDLDRIDGWLTLAVSSPRFVAATVARDLGLPVEVSACGAAVDLAAAGPLPSEVLAVELADGTEVWCTYDGPPAAGRALCDAALRDLPIASGRSFTEPGLRRLAFRR